MFFINTKVTHSNSFFFNFKEKKINQRDLFLKEFRGQTIGSINNQSTVEEIFQNEVLRPILKLQNELFVASFEDHVIKNKIDFNAFSIDKKSATI